MKAEHNGNGNIALPPQPCTHLQLAHRTWKRLQDFKRGALLKINGHDLDIAAVMAVSKYGCLPDIDRSPGVLQDVEESVATLNEYLANGYFLYGVNTGFGGSADTRTTDLYALQRALMQHTQSAVIVGADKSIENTTHEDLALHSMPLAWTKGSMIVRCNANIRGHSAMTLPVIETIIELLRHDFTPLVPLRGSISASGDLMPLSYIAGGIQGSPDVFVRMGKAHGHKVATAEEALRMAGIKPVVLGPKEGLSLINGTAPSAAVASLCLYEAHQVTVLSQLLTCLTAEALGANAEWAHSFIAEVRPHKGQVEAAQNMRMFFKGSKLTYGLAACKDRFKAGLAQERYALRSSPQWIGPQLEDLCFSHDQLTTELNSTSDNPVVNVKEGDIHCGANFQAVSVTMVAEKTRLCLQMIGKLLFSQTTEMINPNLNNGLPANLAADDPSLSFCLKGVDVNMAAYQSELAYLANPVSTHVQSAEMHNQAVNSLALLSSRYTMQAVELVSLMCATTLYTGCQAVDLRVMHRTFLEKFNSVGLTITADIFRDYLAPDALADLYVNVFRKLVENWYETGTLDARERCEKAASISMVVVVDGADGSTNSTSQMSSPSTSVLHSWKTRMQDSMLETYLSHRTKFFKQQSTVQYLGLGPQKLYRFVREELGVPFHQGLVEHPSAYDKQGNKIDGRDKKTIGSWISIIYEALRDGRIHDQVMQCVHGDVEGSTELDGADGTNHTYHTTGINGKNGA